VVAARDPAPAMVPRVRVDRRRLALARGRVGARRAMGGGLAARADLRGQRGIDHLVALAVVPQLLERVVGPDRRLHDVHDDVGGIDQHPVARVLAFGADDVRARCLQPVADIARAGFRLAGRLRGRDDHGIEERGDLLHVDRDDVARRDLLQCLDGDLLLRERTGRLGFHAAPV
jgi:hypothetical protein